MFHAYCIYNKAEYKHNITKDMKQEEKALGTQDNAKSYRRFYIQAQSL